MAKEETFRIVFAGGGSGGHVYPLLAVAETLKKQFTEMGNAPLEMVRMGPKDGFDPLFADRGVYSKNIVSGKIRRYFSISNFTDIPKFFIGFVQALFSLYFLMPDAILSKGGTGALPVVLAGYFYRIPIAVHESDAQPGLTNLVSARFAKKVFVSFERAAKYFNAAKVEVTGTPIRNEFFLRKTTKSAARETLGFSSSSPLMLVLGASQGSVRINNFILTNLSELIKKTQILHQTGVGNLVEVEKLSHAAIIDVGFTNRYQPVGYFIDNMDIALTAADVVIARSGSSTISEIAAFGVPAILIPLTGSANNHQIINAYEFAKTGAAVVIEEANLLPGIFLAQVNTILESQEKQAQMSAASKAFFIPNAAENITKAILAMCA